MRKLSLLLLLLSTSLFAQVQLGGQNSGPMINTGPPPPCFVGVPYTFSAGETGGVLPVAWSTIPSTPVPGLGLINASTGVLGGNGASCTTPGNYQFQLIVTDSVGSQNSVTFTISVQNKLSISAIANPQGEVSFSYTSATPQATGGQAPYMWLCPGCVYPGGLGPINSTTGVISGTATAQGTFPLTLQVTDSANPPNTATALAPITILPAVTITSNGPPTPATQNVAYPAFSVVGQGGTAPLKYTLATGSSALPTGLSLNSSTGAITGTPTVLGTTTNIIFQVADSHLPTNSIATSGPWSITIAAAPPALQFTNTPCGPGTVNVPYACQLAAAGGTGTGFTYALISGSNPPNTSLNAGTGLISGTPLSATTVTPTYQVTDSGAHTATQAESITIAPSTGCGPPLYKCSTTSTAVVQAPTPPFTTTLGVNQIKCDPSLNGTCSSISGIDPIVRATDANTGATGFTVSLSGGANGDNLFSSDDSKVAIIPQNTGGTCVIGFTPSTMQVSTSCTVIPNSGNAYWAHTNGNILYTLSKNTGIVYATTFSSPSSFSQSVLFNPITGCLATGNIPFITGPVTGGSITLSLDDNIIVGALTTSVQNTPGWVFAYNQTTHQCSAVNTANGQVLLFNGTISASTMPCTPIGLHNANIFSNGTYARFTTFTDGPCTNTPEQWQINTTNVFVCGTNLSGHNFNGFNVEVVISNPAFHFADVTSGSYCANLLSQSYGSGLQLSNGQTGDIESHFGAEYITSADSQPIVVGTSWANQPVGTQWVAPTINELWAFQRSPFLIQRFFHLFNSSIVICPTCDFRDTEAIVGQSQTGKFAVFCSDMNLSLGSSTNGTRIDAFIGRLD